MLRLGLTFAALLTLAVPSVLGKAGKQTNFPYVTSFFNGVWYTRSVPANATGPEGRTTLFRVGADRDDVIQSYDWYASGGLHLGWSPIAGKWAVMAVHEERAPQLAHQPEFSFHLGADRLATYTTADLVALGATLTREEADDSRRADILIKGVEQIPRTNEYVFKVVVHTADGDREVLFDILTGKPYQRRPPTTTGS